MGIGGRAISGWMREGSATTGTASVSVAADDMVNCRYDCRRDRNGVAELKQNNAIKDELEK